MFEIPEFSNATFLFVMEVVIVLFDVASPPPQNTCAQSIYNHDINVVFPGQIGVPSAQTSLLINVLFL